ncbi:uncharacterized protein N7515_010133 [Penicillium bovifimosum]|uniref:Rhodopsin domain-containing protein n=1 Tax=Penicillium bovifimosum TaxID=126998 RepID=A0A9W9GI95_9EURO|nr:uncharacterized protein N7515_010133 [Penicillium bovifimosum]KAJ5120745.1 hypothetical protein N7515_010133 [Penicillium bovifimosum]
MAWVHNLHGSDPHSRIGRAIVMCVVFPVLALMAVCLRFYVRLRTKRAPWVDDYAVLISVLLTAIYAGLTIARECVQYADTASERYLTRVETRWGMGLSQAYFPEENTIAFSKIQYAGGPVYTLNLLAFKLALLTSYYRIGGFVKSYRVTILIAIAVCATTQVIFTLIMSLACKPIPKQWDITVSGKCIDTVSFYYGTNLGFDVAIIILPLPVLWKLQLHRKQKCVLIGMFALGFFVTIIQIIRIFSVKNLKNITDSEGLILWSIVEVSLGAIITCIPTFSPLFKSFATTITSYRNNGMGRSYALESAPEYGTGKCSSFKSSKRTTFGRQQQSNTTVIGSNLSNAATYPRNTDSEEEILGERDNGRIYKTVDFKVENV